MGCFQFGAISTGSARNALLHASWLTYVRISLGEIPGSGIAGSEDIHMGSFSRYCQIVFKVVAPVCTLTRSVQGSCCCASLPVLSITGLIHPGYSGGVWHGVSLLRTSWEGFLAPLPARRCCCSLLSTRAIIGTENVSYFLATGRWLCFYPFYRQWAFAWALGTGGQSTPPLVA